MPDAFTQAPLLTDSGFRREAKKWGHFLCDRDLEELAQLGLLIPFFRTRDGYMPRAAGRDEQVSATESANDEGVVDPNDDSDGPDGEGESEGERWYSSWQLLALRDALPILRSRRTSRWNVVDDDLARASGTQHRSMHIALEALANRFYPGITGKLTAPTGSTLAELRRTGAALNTRERLEAVDGLPSMLQQRANELLTVARHDDPLGGWWQLARHSNHRGWFKLKGAALQAVWQRIAAEVLLRAHEELADLGDLPSLTEPIGNSWHPLMDRIRAETPPALTLDHALTQLAVSPHPLVVVVVEGDTEHEHMTALMTSLGLRHRVRVVNQRGSGGSPHQLAGYLAPQVREVLPGRQDLERNPTPIFVAMDSENVWSPDKKDGSEQKLRARIREEVRRHEGAEISEADLDELLKVRVWPDERTYEMANFSDDELTDALLTVRPNHIADREDLSSDVLAAVQYAREKRLDFGVALKRLRWEVNLKVPVARALTPGLVARLGDDPATLPPVVTLALDIAEAAEQMSMGRIYLSGGAQPSVAPSHTP